VEAPDAVKVDPVLLGQISVPLETILKDATGATVMLMV
jgi:hypothetical protein